ncbi:hypothetical protein EBR66_03815 [bacterium]|nr:hypothetical protein [bacterium]
MKKTALFLLVIIAPLFTSAASASDLSITREGSFNAKNLVVIQKAGTNIFARAVWGDSFIRITLLTSTSTKVEKAYGESARVDDISEGDTLDVDGVLANGAGTIIVKAQTIKDYALVRDRKVLSGTVLDTNTNAFVFTLLGKNKATTTVQLSASTMITKGKRTIEFSDIRVGDRINMVEGMYDYPTNTLTVSKIDIYQDQKIFAPRVFEGILLSTSSSLPATIMLAIGTKGMKEYHEYAVYLSGDTVVYNKAKKKTELSRFVVGDTVRIFGAIRLTNLNEIDAEVIRTMAF